MYYKKFGEHVVNTERPEAKYRCRSKWKSGAQERFQAEAFLSLLADQGNPVAPDNSGSGSTQRGRSKVNHADEAALEIVL